MRGWWRPLSSRLSCRFAKWKPGLKPRVSCRRQPSWSGEGASQSPVPQRKGWIDFWRVSSSLEAEGPSGRTEQSMPPSWALEPTGVPPFDGWQGCGRCEHPRSGTPGPPPAQNPRQELPAWGFSRIPRAGLPPDGGQEAKHQFHCETVCPEICSIFFRFFVFILLNFLPAQNSTCNRHSYLWWDEIAFSWHSMLQNLKEELNLMKGTKTGWGAVGTRKIWEKIKKNMMDEKTWL